MPAVRKGGWSLRVKRAPPPEKLSHQKQDGEDEVEPNRSLPRDLEPVGFLERGLEAADEAHVLVVDVDVDESVQFPTVDESFGDPGVVALQVRYGSGP